MRLCPQLMFEGRVDEALAFWRGAFPAMEVRDLADSGTGPTRLVEVTLGGARLRLFDSPVPHGFTFTPSISLLVECDSGAEVDRLAAYLGDGGSFLMPLDAYDFSPRFAFLVDRLGVSWQIMQVPE